MEEECAWENHVQIDGTHCPSVYDLILCWPPAQPNRTVYQLCPLAGNSSDAYAFRICLPDGTWYRNWTNYSYCVSDLVEPTSGQGNDGSLYIILRDVCLATSLISLIFLLITLFIFCYFRSLQCSRISIHKHLVVSFSIHFLVILVRIQPSVIDTGFYYESVDWLCKFILALEKYTQMANFAWMLVEGIYLHNRLAISVFTSSAPFKLFCFIGWGLPLLITFLWAGLMQEFFPVPCWRGFSKHNLILIIFLPILFALIVNCAFLVNIIRVLVVKLRTNNTAESRRIRKAIKATVVLVPLLGVANIVFLLHPTNERSVVHVYQTVNAVLPSCQGIFVAVLYCFMNTEVQNVITKKWRRFRTNRAMSVQSRRPGLTTTTSFSFMSHGESQGSQRVPSRGKPLIGREKDYHSMAPMQTMVTHGQQSLKNGKNPGAVKLNNGHRFVIQTNSLKTDTFDLNEGPMDVV